MTLILEKLNAFVWGVPALVMILFVGIYLTLRLKGVQFALLPRAIQSFLKKIRPEKNSDGVSSYRALCTALAATVGTGNLAGVAGAICLGGPGAVFWMWICGFLGMVTKYAEATLAIRYRVRGEAGYHGGPMYVIVNGLGRKWLPLAKLYCIFGAAASFGVGNATQIGAVISGFHSILESSGIVPAAQLDMIAGLLLAAVIGTLLLGGAGRIGAAAEILVPFGAVGYLLMCFGVLIAKADAIPEAFCAIVRGALDPKAVTGGALGSAFVALRVGCSRGVFTNEAGMGTAAIAHASAEVSHPAEQGLMGMVEVFLDTILICTLTALVILVSGVPVPYGMDGGAALTVDAFRVIYGDAAAVVLTGALLLFAVAAILGWGLYGGRCVQFLLGPKAWKPYALMQSGVVLLSSVASAAVLWQVSELLNGLMAIPNLLSLALLMPETVRLTREYVLTARKKQVEHEDCSTWEYRNLIRDHRS